MLPGINLFVRIATLGSYIFTNLQQILMKLCTIFHEFGDINRLGIQISKWLNVKSTRYNTWCIDRLGVRISYANVSQHACCSSQANLHEYLPLLWTIRQHKDFLDSDWTEIHEKRSETISGNISIIFEVLNNLLKSRKTWSYNIKRRRNRYEANTNWNVLSPEG